MLSKQSRISRKDFKIFFEKSPDRQGRSGGYFNSPNFTLKVSREEAKVPKFAVSVSKKVSKHAVDRNRVRRRAYSALRGVDAKPGLYLLIAKPSTLGLKGDKLKSEISKLIGSVKS